MKAGFRGKTTPDRQHFKLAEQFHNLLRAKPILRPDPSSFPSAFSHIAWSKNAWSGHHRPEHIGAQHDSIIHGNRHIPVDPHSVSGFTLFSIVHRDPLSTCNLGTQLTACNDANLQRMTFRKGHGRVSYCEQFDGRTENRVAD